MNWREEVWTTSDGREIPVVKMTENHVRNCVRFLKTEAGAFGQQDEVDRWLKVFRACLQDTSTPVLGWLRWRVRLYLDRDLPDWRTKRALKRRISNTLTNHYEEIT